MRHTLAFLTLVSALYGRGGQSSQTVPVALVPCAVPGIGTRDSVWHQVRASGFTFCVPPAWQPAGHSHDSIDAKRWHGDGGSVTWDFGRPPAFEVGYASRTITGTIGRSRYPPNLAPLPPTSYSQPCRPQTNTPLTLDGVSLLLTQVQCRATWTTTAWSTTPVMYVQGEAHSEKVAELLLVIMQTIRFTSEVFEERTVILTNPPDAMIVVDAETLAAVAPLLIRHRRERVGGVAKQVRIRVLPVLPGQCPQVRVVPSNESAPDTVSFQMDRCPRTEQDFARVFDVDELDEAPTRLRGPLLPDPEFVLRSARDGLVILRLIIDTAGLPEAGSLETVKATDSGFALSATRTVLGSVFKPGRILGRKVRV